MEVKKKLILKSSSGQQQMGGNIEVNPFNFLWSQRDFLEREEEENSAREVLLLFAHIKDE